MALNPDARLFFNVLCLLIVYAKQFLLLLTPASCHDVKSRRKHEWNIKIWYVLHPCYHPPPPEGCGGDQQTVMKVLSEACFSSLNASQADGRRSESFRRAFIFRMHKPKGFFHLHHLWWGFRNCRWSHDLLGHDFLEFDFWLKDVTFRSCSDPESFLACFFFCTSPVYCF